MGTIPFLLMATAARKAQRRTNHTHHKSSYYSEGSVTRGKTKRSLSREDVVEILLENYYDRLPIETIDKVCATSEAAAMKVLQKSLEEFDSLYSEYSEISEKSIEALKVIYPDEEFEVRYIVRPSLDNRDSEYYYPRLARKPYYGFHTWPKALLAEDGKLLKKPEGYDSTTVENVEAKIDQLKARLDELKVHPVINKKKIADLHVSINNLEKLRDEYKKWECYMANEEMLDRYFVLYDKITAMERDLGIADGKEIYYRFADPEVAKKQGVHRVFFDEIAKFKDTLKSKLSGSRQTKNKERLIRDVLFFVVTNPEVAIGFESRATSSKNMPLSYCYAQADHAHYDGILEYCRDIAEEVMKQLYELENNHEKGAEDKVGNDSDGETI